MVCPPQQFGGPSSVWTRAVAHNRDTSVILFPFPFFLWPIAFFFQVHDGGAEALEQMRVVLNQLAEAHDAQGPAVEPDGDNPDDDNDYLDDNADDNGDGRIAISELRGILTDDVGWLMLLLLSMMIGCF